MIPDTYDYLLVHRDISFSDGLFYDLYRFKSKKSKLFYFVRVEKYPHNMYAVKFYLKNHRYSDRKYQLLTNTNEPRRIINTCINIMLSIYNSNSSASFGFIGSNSEGESISNTKRYRVYSRITATYFSDALFEHVENIERSVYMLINKTELGRTPDLLNKIQDVFMDLYQDFD